MQSNEHRAYNWETPAYGVWNAYKMLIYFMSIIYKKIFRIIFAASSGGYFTHACE